MVYVLGGADQTYCIGVLGKWCLQGCSSLHAKAVNAECPTDTSKAVVRVDVRMSDLHHLGRQDNTLGHHLSQAMELLQVQLFIFSPEDAICPLLSPS